MHGSIHLCICIQCNLIFFLLVVDRFRLDWTGGSHGILRNKRRDRLFLSKKAKSYATIPLTSFNHIYIPIRIIYTVQNSIRYFIHVPVHVPYKIAF